MKTFLLFAIPVLCATLAGTANAQWISQASGTRHRLNGVSSTDANTGTVVGDSGTILRTTVGGYAQVTFTAVTAGMNIDGTGAGVVWGDFNNDDLLDLFMPAPGEMPLRSRLYKNNGNGTFTDVAAAVGLNIGNTWGGSWADIDNDGDLDLATYGPGAPDTMRLWLNNRQSGADTTFTSIEGTAGITTSWAQMSVWADYDRDGYVDLYSPVRSGSSSDALYRNNHNNTFTNVADSAGVNHQVSGVEEEAVHWGDYNKDGYPDLFISNRSSTTGTSYFHRNNGNGTFTEIASTLGFQAAGGGAQWVDYNNDGLWDFSYASGGTIKLFRNNGDGTFTEVASASGITDVVNSTGVTWADYDNNGYEDVFVSASGEQPHPQLFKNNGNGTFTDVTSVAGTHFMYQYCAAWADYNNDGWMDLYVSGPPETGGGNRLLRNNGDSTKQWIEIKLIGSQSNRAGIGAQIDVKAGPLRMMREINTGTDCQSQNMLRAHFGLNTNTTVDSIIVRWPSGVRTVRTNVAADQFITISEQIVGVPEKKEQPTAFSLSQNYPNPFNPVTIVQFSIANRELTVLKAYDLLGREVATLVNEVKQPGTYTAQWDASRVASGIYFYRLTAGSFVETKKCVLMK